MKRLFTKTRQEFKAFVANLVLDYLSRQNYHFLLAVIQRGGKFYKMEFKPITKAQMEQLQAKKYIDGCYDEKGKLSKPNVEEEPLLTANLN